MTEIRTRYNYGEGYLRTIITRGVNRKGYACSDGPYTEFYNAPGEIVKKQGSYKGGKLDGELTEFYLDGKIQCKSTWKEGLMISLQEFDQEGRVIKNLEGDL